VRWDNLFDDLEGQLEQELRADENGQRVEEERLRIGRLGIRDRLVSVVESYPRRADYSIRVHLVSGALVRVRPVAVGKDWLSADVRDGSSADVQCIIPFTAIVGLGLDTDQARSSLESPEPPRPGALAAKLTVAFVLRDLARRRTSVEVVTRSGSVTGTIDRAGRDHLELAVHERGEPRRREAVVEARLVPLDALVMVRL
jgi:hypothetical protein